MPEGKRRRRRKKAEAEESSGIFGYFASTTPAGSGDSGYSDEDRDDGSHSDKGEQSGTERGSRSGRGNPRSGRGQRRERGMWASAMSMVGLASESDRDYDSHASLSDIDVNDRAGRERREAEQGSSSTGSGGNLSDDSKEQEQRRVQSNRRIGEQLAAITTRARQQKGWMQAADRVVESRQKQKLNAVQLALLNAQSHMKQADELKAAEARGVSSKQAAWGDMVTKIDDDESKKQLEQLGAEVKDGKIVRKISSVVPGLVKAASSRGKRGGGGDSHGSGSRDGGSGGHDGSSHGSRDSRASYDSRGSRHSNDGAPSGSDGGKLKVDSDGAVIKMSSISVAGGPKTAAELEEMKNGENKDNIEVVKKQSSRRRKRGNKKKRDTEADDAGGADGGMAEEGEFEDELAMLYLARWDLRVTEAEYVLEFERSANDFKQETLKRICGSLQRIGLVLEFSDGTSGEKVYAKVAAPMSLLHWWATRIKMEVKLRPIGYFLSRNSLANHQHAEAFMGRKFGDGEVTSSTSDVKGLKEDDDFTHRDPGSAPFDKDKKHLFEDFRSSERQQLIWSLMTAPKKDGGAGLNFAKELRINNGFIQMFPTHCDAERDPLIKTWGNSWLKRQPLDEVRDYFGERVTLYFAFLGFYSRWLAIPGIIGVFCFVWGIASGKADNILTPVYALLLAFWVTIFLEFWKRYNSGLSWRWNMLHFTRVEETRPAFQGKWTPGFYTETGFVKLEEKDLKGVDMKRIKHDQFATPWKQAAKFTTSYAFISLLVGIAIVVSVMLLVLRIILGDSIPRNTYSIRGQTVSLVWGHVITGAISGTWISLSNKGYAWLAEWLTEYENHRTVSEHENHLAIKVFLFQFINSYFSLFYIAFLKSSSLTLFGRNDSCSPDCITELTYQLGSLFIARQLTQMTLQVIIPYGMLWWTRWRARAALHRRWGRKIPPHTEEEQQALLLPHESLIHEYVDLVISYGYITMFASSFPVSSFLALFTNFLEIRIDANRMLRWTQRPLYHGAKDIGVFYNILQLVGVVAVVTNALIIGIVSRDLYAELGVTLSDSGKVWAVVIAEHIIFLGKALLMMMIPDQPKSVRDGIAVQKFHQNLLMHDDDIVEDWEVDTTQVSIDLPHLHPPV